MSFPIKREQPTIPKDHAGLTDEEILGLVVQGRHHAFDLLVARYGGRVRRFIRRVVGGDAALDDLTQEVFVRAFRRSSQPWEPGMFKGWIFRVARTVSVDHLRRAKVEQKARLILEARGPGGVQEPTPAVVAERREFREHLDHALATLPEVLRTAFLLREQEGLSYEEIAEVLRTSPKTISTRIFRARARLRGLLQPWLTFGQRAQVEETL